MKALAESSSLAATLARVAAFDEFLALEPTVDGRDDWIEATDLAAALPACLEHVGREARTADVRIQAALFVWGYAWKVAAPAIACYLIERRVPDVGPENVALRLDPAGGVGHVALRRPRFAEVGHGFASSPWEVALQDDAALRSWLRARLESHFALTVAAIRESSPLGRRAPWALAADCCATAFLHVGKKLGRDRGACVEAENFFAVPGAGSRFRSRATFFSLEHEGRLEFFLRRSSCCLYYKVPQGEYCTTCPLLSEAERERRLRAELQGE